MLRTQRIGGLRACGPNVAAGVILFVALTAGGCSADLGRFDFPSAGYGPDGRSTAALGPVPNEPLRRSNAGAPIGDERESSARPWGGGSGPPRGAVYGSEPQGGGYRPGESSGYGSPTASQDTRMAALPPAHDPAAERESKYNYRGSEPKLREPQRAAPSYAPTSQRSMPASTSIPVSSNTIEVQPGDTLTGLAKQHRVSVAELMSVNNLQSPVVRPGQKLALPAGKRVVTQRIPVTAPVTTRAERDTAVEDRQRQAPTPVAAASSPDWQGTHTIASGESLYGIARKHNVKVAELQEVNGIANVTRIRPGTVIKVPGKGEAPSKAIAAAPSRMETASGGATPPLGQGSSLTIRPRIINGEAGEPAEPKRVASLGPAPKTATDAPAADAEPKGDSAPTAAQTSKLTGGSGKFRWPAKGKVIAGFGARPDKSHNDGINISVPQGAEVMAAESGVVAYSGNELKGYGNLILIRHDGGWVSAYGHNDELLVKRGDRIKRGQAIAKAGNTGSVDRPQVHFELRQDSKPVDPLPHMEKQ